MIELRKYELMHVYRTRSSKHTHICDLSQSGGGGGGGGGGLVYEIKILRNNLAPEEGGRSVYSRGAYIRASTVY